MYSFGRSIVRYNDIKFVSGNSDPMVSLFPKVMISKGKDYFVLLCIVHGCPGLTEFLTCLASRFFQCFCIEHYRPVSGSLFQIIISGLQLSVYDLSDLSALCRLKVNQNYNQ